MVSCRNETTRSIVSRQGATGVIPEGVDVVGESLRDVAGLGQSSEARQVQLQRVLALAVLVHLEVIPASGTCE
jgi:hypothetical protein